MDPAGSHPHPDEDEQYSGSRRSGRFRFKKSRSHSRRDDDSGHRHHHHRHHRHREGKRSRRDEPDEGENTSKRHKIYTDNNNSADAHDTGELSPDAAFRESLFDALGDDEGADYWESVYGQPIHTYPIPSVPKGPKGKLEQMSDDEYASYVRARMWERTHEGVMEERERLRAEKAKFKEEQRKWERESQERIRFECTVQDSLRRGRERKRAKAWTSVWSEYRQSWQELDRMVAMINAKGEDAGMQSLRNLLFWPVESGKRKEVSPESVREFIRHAPPGPPDSTTREPKRKDLLAILKTERVRWHPDKIQHRYGVLGIEAVVMQSVTEVFQIIDQMWNDEREKED